MCVVLCCVCFLLVFVVFVQSMVGDLVVCRV